MWDGILSQPLYYDRDGKPLDSVFDWARLHNDDAYKRVAEDTVGDAWISTVWLGINHNVMPLFDALPIIFETMIFGGEHDQFQDRYATLQQAEAGHARVVQALREGNNPENPY